MKRRNTEQKAAIYETIHGIGNHMTAEEVKKALDEKGQSVGLATIYRNLNLLCEEGVIQKFTVDDHSFFDGNAKPHDHFHCVRCGCIKDIDAKYNSQLDKKAMKDTGAKIMNHSVTFNGICENCLKEEETKQWN